MNISLQLGSGFSSISATNSAEFHLTVQRREVDLFLNVHGASSISIKTFLKVRVLYSTPQMTQIDADSSVIAFECQVLIL